MPSRYRWEQNLLIDFLFCYFVDLFVNLSEIHLCITYDLTFLGRMLSIFSKFGNNVIFN